MQYCLVLDEFLANNVVKGKENKTLSFFNNCEQGFEYSVYQNAFVIYYMCFYLNEYALINWADPKMPEQVLQLLLIS